MAIAVSIIISILALLATFYQLHLQRVHNEKSLKPLGQIILDDRSHTISVRLYNNGLGPLIVDRLAFVKSDNIYSSIKDCLDLDPKSYDHISMDDLVGRVILANSYLTVFEKNFRNQADETDINHIRMELSPITLRVGCRDIYDNKFTIERDFQWFSRYMLKEDTER